MPFLSRIAYHQCITTPPLWERGKDKGTPLAPRQGRAPAPPFPIMFRGPFGRNRYPGGENHEIEVRKSSTSAGCARRRRRDNPGGVRRHIGRLFKQLIDVRKYARTRGELQTRCFADLQQHRLLDQLYLV